MLVALLAVVAALSGCGPQRDATLAVAHARRRSPTVVELRTECADHVRVSLGRAPDGKPEVTVTGRPRLGRCQPSVLVHLQSDHLVDGATSMAFEVRPAR
ncbi:MAG: hypothetical protein JWN46_2150 [Acidimicrobiales bacterium]|nr:hypothetical protein [Acidimicrobiales bacterium]